MVSTKVFHHDHYARMLWGIFDDAFYEAAIDPLFLVVTPINIPFRLTVDRIGWVNGDTPAGSVKVGIYNDNGDTPAGGSLVVGSASIAQAGASQKQEGTIADTVLTPGLYWLAILITSDPDTPDLWLTFANGGGTLRTYGYINPDTNLPDPYPSEGYFEMDGPLMYIRVKSVL